MSFIEIFLIGVALSMDAFAVSVTTGITLKNPHPWPALKTGLFFGGFQALMPLLGYLAGSTIVGYISSLADWIAFLLLAVIGGKMVWDSFHDEEGEEHADPTRTLTLLVMAIATSIDALAVGISFAMVTVNIWQAITIIGCTTFVISVAGVYLGKRLGSMFEKRATLVGGLVLIGIGVKILIEHFVG